VTPPQVHGGTSGDGNERITLRVLDPKADGCDLDGVSLAGLGGIARQKASQPPVATALRRTSDLVAGVEDPCCTRLLMTKIFF